MNYIGSKRTLLNKIKGIILSSSGNNNNRTFCDLFAGTGVVSAEMKPHFKKIIANDLEYYSYVLLKNYVELQDEIFLDFDYMNDLIPVDGLIYEYYARDRMYFTEINAKKIDAIRQYIERFNDDERVYFHLLASLLESADKVANTTSVYAAFLKEYKETARKRIEVKPANIYGALHGFEAEIYNEKANHLIKKISGDVLYLDPPYNSRQYGSNYHVLNTIAKYESIVPQGKTGLPEDYNKSPFSSKMLAKMAMIDLYDNADFKHIFLSYNNFGILDIEDIHDIIDRQGKVETFIIDYKPYKSRVVGADQEETKEYVIYLRRP